MTDTEKVELLAKALNFYAPENWSKEIWTAKSSFFVTNPPDTGWTARNALEQIGLRTPPPVETTFKYLYGPKGIWDYERCGHKKFEWGKDKDGRKIANTNSAVEVFTPACLKCLIEGVELNACAACCHEPSMGTKLRLFCDKCLKSHKNPRDCSDCGAV